MLGRNVFTGLTVVFEGTPQGTLATGVKQATILKHAKENMCIPANGWNFRFIDEHTTWPVHSDKHLLIYKKYPMYPPNGMTVIDTLDNSEVFLKVFL